MRVNVQVDEKGKLSLTEEEQHRLEQAGKAQEEEARAAEGHLPCGCEFGFKFNGGNPRWFRTDSCSRHQNVDLGVTPKVFDPDTITALLEALL